MTIFFEEYFGKKILVEFFWGGFFWGGFFWEDFLGGIDVLSRFWGNARRRQEI